MDRKIMVIKKNGNLEKFDPMRVKRAVCASAERVMVKLTEDALERIVCIVVDLLHT